MGVMRARVARWTGTWRHLCCSFLLAATGCGDGTDSEEDDRTTMLGVLGASSRASVDSVWATYHREITGCPGSSVPLGQCRVTSACSAERVPELLDAGTVTVAGTSLTRAGSYFASLPDGLPYGELVVAEAMGSSAVPAHRLSMVLPEPATIVEPAAEDLVVDRTRDFLVRWQGGREGTMNVSVSSSSTSVLCRASLDAEAIAIPSSLLAELDPSDAETEGSFGAYQWNDDATSEAEWQFFFFASIELFAAAAVIQ
jgi:hypothetical protein